MTTPNPNGNPDSYFIARVRRDNKDQGAILQDPFTGDGNMGTLAAGSKPFRLQRSPLIYSSVALTAPAPANSVGFTLWTVLTDRFFSFPPGFPFLAPAITDQGAGGTWAVGTYQLAFCFVDANGNRGPLSPPSNALAIAANRIIGMPAIPAGSVPLNATQLEWWVTSSLAGGSSVGRAAIIAVTNPGLATATVAAQNVAAPPAAFVGQIPMTVNTDTGELIFPQAPGVGNINVTYAACRYSDQTILDALTEGLNELWPKVWQEALDTTSVAPSPTTFEYALPAIFGDPRVVLIAVEVAPPSGLVIYESTSLWDQIGQTTLRFNKAFAPGSTVRLRYNAPYQALSDLEASAMWIPVYYALHKLTMNQETSRSRAGDIQAQTGEGAVKPGDSSRIAMMWLEKYEKAREELSPGDAMREDVPQRSVDLLDQQRRKFSWKPS